MIFRMETCWGMWTKMYIFFYELTILFVIFLTSSMFCQWNFHCSSKGTDVNICWSVEHICMVLNTRQMLVQRLLLRSVRLKTRLLAGIQYASSRSCDRKTPSFSVVYLGLTANYTARQTTHRTSFLWHSTLDTNFKFPQLPEFKIQNRNQPVELFPVLHISMWTVSIVGTATRYGMVDPGIGSRRDRVFFLPSRSSLGPTQPPKQLVPDHSRR